MSEYQLTASDVVIRKSDGTNFGPGHRFYAEYLAWAAAGGVPDPYAPPAPPPVTTVTPRQARLALLAAGLLDQVEAAVASAGGATKITWDYAAVINRDDPLITTLGASLNLTSAQIDALFTQAATL